MLSSSDYILLFFNSVDIGFPSKLARYNSCGKDWMVNFQAAGTDSNQPTMILVGSMAYVVWCA